MHIRQKLIAVLALTLVTVPMKARSLVYVVNGGSQQFGTVDLATGAFTQIGPATAEGSDGLTPGPNGSLFTLTYSGNLDSIDPVTGITSFIGATGLGDCTSPASPCLPSSASNVVGFGGAFYATDLANNLYTVDPATGAATLKGATGIPPLPFHLLDTNPDGSTNLFDETLFGSNGNLYATFDAITIDFATFAITPVIPAGLYQIDPLTGFATYIAPTALNLSAAADVNGTVYAFNGALNQVVTLDLANGNTTFFSDLDPAAGLIAGASPVAPEPASIALGGIGIAAILLSRRRKRCL